MKALVDADNTLSRFEAKYIPEPNSGCWLWTAGVDSSGYGTFIYDGRTLGAHRVSFMLHRGVIPGGLLVCHTCDVRVCVNPNHLFLGTIQDNIDDRDRKGRHPRLRGNAGTNSKLTEDQVIEILEKHDGKVNTIYTLGVEYKVHPTTIHLILKGRNWSHVTRRGLDVPRGRVDVHESI